ncbi:MAG TPA: hypothetical protein VMY88_09050 [Acidimicrobiales bacterium]|nr:hypothetical protein [Acidimicrobiales bacterium]
MALLAAPALVLLALFMVVAQSDADRGSTGLEPAAAAHVLAPVIGPGPSPAGTPIAEPPPAPPAALPTPVAPAAGAPISAPPAAPPKVVAPSLECAAALAAVEHAGLKLPETTAFRCPGSTEQFGGDRQHSGVACWGQPLYCPGGSFIAVNPDATGSGQHHLQYVVAHEICHIEAYVAGALGGTEAAADECAARAGFPRP